MKAEEIHKRYHVEPCTCGSRNLDYPEVDLWTCIMRRVACLDCERQSEKCYQIITAVQCWNFLRGVAVFEQIEIGTAVRFNSNSVNDGKEGVVKDVTTMLFDALYTVKVEGEGEYVCGRKELEVIG